MLSERIMEAGRFCSYKTSIYDANVLVSANADIAKNYFHINYDLPMFFNLLGDVRGCNVLSLGCGSGYYVRYDKAI